MLGEISKSPTGAVDFTAKFLGYELMLTNPGAVAFDLPRGKFSVAHLWGPSVLMGFEGEQSVSAITYDGRLGLTHTSASPMTGLLQRASAVIRAACASAQDLPSQPL